MNDIAQYFKKSEFTCKCGCGFSDISVRLVHELDKVRELLGRQLIITSGCRCSDHNRQAGGKENSDHLKGLAADLRVNSSIARFEVLQALLMVGISRIGIGENFIHVELNDSKPQQVVWLY